MGLKEEEANELYLIYCFPEPAIFVGAPLDRLISVSSGVVSRCVCVLLVSLIRGLLWLLLLVLLLLLLLLLRSL